MTFGESFIFIYKKKHTVEVSKCIRIGRERTCHSTNWGFNFGIHRNVLNGMKMLKAS